MAMDLLFCEEEISWSPWIDRIDQATPSTDTAITNTEAETTPSSSCNYSSPISSSSTQYPPTNCTVIGFFSASSSFGPLEDMIQVDAMLLKEVDCMPGQPYLAALLQINGARSARCKAIKWLIEAQSHFNFSPLTTTLAVNYFDRYLARNISKAWAPWMFELLAVACLSIAAKMEEVVVPQIIDLQQGGSMENAFDPVTVQRMELVVLSSLGWKLRSITPVSFLELALCEVKVSMLLHQPLSTRIMELVLGALQEAEFVNVCPSILAATAICCALEELVPMQTDDFKRSAAAKLILQDNQEQFLNCYKLMEELVIDLVAPTSPSSTLQPIYVRTSLTSASTSTQPVPALSVSGSPSSSLSLASFLRSPSSDLQLRVVTQLPTNWRMWSTSTPIEHDPLKFARLSDDSTASCVQDCHCLSVHGCEYDDDAMTEKLHVKPSCPGLMRVSQSSVEYRPGNNLPSLDNYTNGGRKRRRENNGTG